MLFHKLVELHELVVSFLCVVIRKHAALNVSGHLYLCSGFPPCFERLGGGLNRLLSLVETEVGYLAKFLRGSGV